MSEKIYELKKKYSGKWLAIKVTKRGPYKVPIEGILIAEADTHHELHAKNTEDPNVYETYAGEAPTIAVLF